MSQPTFPELADEIPEDEAEAINVLAGITAEHGLAGDRERDGERQRDLAQRLAALLVRRATNQHGCTGTVCRHRDHDRDVDYCREMLDALELPRQYPVVTDQDREEFVGSVATRLPRHNRPASGKPRWNRSFK